MSESFVVRPGLDGSGHPLIEFQGDHRSGRFLAKSDHAQVIEAIAAGLGRTDAFRRADGGGVV